MSEVEAKATQDGKKKHKEKQKDPAQQRGPIEPDYIAYPIDRTMDVAFETVQNHTVLLPADPRILNPEAAEAAAEGKFDRKSARFIPRMIEPTQRVLNIGSGMGFIPIHICLTYPDAIVLGQEDRDDLTKIAREIAALNGLEQSSNLRLTDGPLFFATDRGGQASGLAALIKDFHPHVLRIDDDRINAAVIQAQDLSGIARVIISEATVGRYAVQLPKVKEAIEAAGYGLDERYEPTGALVYYRKA